MGVCWNCGQTGHSRRECFRLQARAWAAAAAEGGDSESDTDSIDALAARLAAVTFDFPRPPVDTPGKWLPRSVCTMNKSFGWFLCDCGNKWTSAHAHRRYKQACRDCEEYRLPDYMWLNEPTSEPSARARIVDTPHDQGRCEACKAGRCLA